jgi:hypothetical protein
LKILLPRSDRGVGSASVAGSDGATATMESALTFALGMVALALILATVLVADKMMRRRRRR